MSKFIMVSDEEFEKIAKLLITGEALEWAKENYEFSFIKYCSSDGVYAIELDLLINNYIEWRDAV